MSSAAQLSVPNDPAEAAALILDLKERANTHMDAKEPDAALPLFQLAISTASALLDPFDEVHIALLMNVARFYALVPTSKGPDAKEIGRRNLEVCELVYGHIHPISLQALRYLVTLIGPPGGEYPNDYEKLIRRVLDGCDKIYGKNHLPMIDAWDQFAFFLRSRGRLAESERALTERLALLNKVKGPKDELSTMAAAKLAYNLLEQCFDRKEGKVVVDKFKVAAHLVRVLELCSIYPSAIPLLLLVSSQLLLWSRDDANTRIALHVLVTTYKQVSDCKICQKRLGNQEIPAICRTCRFLYLCLPCYETYRTRGLDAPKLPPECDDHDFLEAAESNLSTGLNVEIWLSELLAEKAKPSEGGGRENGKGDRSPNNSPRFAGESANADYAKFRLPNGLPPDLGSEGEKSVIWTENLERSVRDLRILQVRERIPQMLHNWFNIDGYGTIGLQEWDEENQAEEELEHHLNAVLDLSLGPMPAPSGRTFENREHSSAPDSLYHQEDLIIHEGVLAIRVLELLSCDTETIRGRMRRMVLTGIPKYDALSYVWGRPDPLSPKTLEVNGGVLKITTNLHAALTAVMKGSANLTIWVDAVCINQEDLLERNQQVAMMSQIYKSATTVRIYLGGELPLLSQYFHQCSNNGCSPGQIIDSFGPRSAALMGEFIDFISLPWWTRVWILQEYALAKNDPVFYLGTSQISASTIRYYSGTIAKRTLIACEPYLGVGSRAQTDAMFNTIASRYRHTQALLANRDPKRAGVGHFVSPWQVFDKYFQTRSTDPRDRIFGVLELLEPTARDVLKPDYRISKEDVFMRLAAWMLMFDYCEDMYWLYPVKMAGAPSWVPDFSRPVDWMPDPYMPTSAAELELSRALALSQGEKSPKVLANIRGWPPIIHNRVLASGGRLVDTIDRVYEVDQESWTERLLRLWYLDVHFTTTGFASPFPPTDPLSELREKHGKTGLNSWADKAKFTIAFHSGKLGVNQYFKNLHEEFSRTGSQLKDQIGEHHSPYSITFWKILRLRVQELLRIREKERQMELQNVLMQAALQTVVCRLLALNKWLSDDITRPKSFVGAALFDYDNFERQIRHLRNPRGDPNPLTRTSGLSKSVQDAVISRLTRIIQDDGFVDWTRAEPTERPYGLDAPMYDDLQGQICNCETAVEVRLRVQLVLRIARSLRETFNREESTGKLDNFNHLSNIMVGDWAKSLLPPDLAGHMRWIRDDISRTAWIWALSGGVGVVAAITMLQSRALRSRSMRFCGSAVAIGLALGSTIGFLGSSMTANASGIELETPEVVNELETGNLHWKEKYLESPVARSTQGDVLLQSASVQAQWQNRTFFTTKLGFVGLGSPGVTDIRHGDHVVFLENARLPMVVREPEGMEGMEMVGFSVLREFITEDRKKLEGFKKLKQRVFRFV